MICWVQDSSPRQAAAILDNKEGLNIRVPFFRPTLQPMGSHFSPNASGILPSGKRLHNELENHHFQWENPLFRLGHFQQLCNKLPEGIELWFCLGAKLWLIAILTCAAGQCYSGLTSLSFVGSKARGIQVRWDTSNLIRFYSFSTIGQCDNPN